MTLSLKFTLWTRLVSFPEFGRYSRWLRLASADVSPQLNQNSFFWARDRENYTPVGFQGATLLVPRRKVTDDAPGVAHLFPSHKLCKPRHPKIAEAEKEISRMRCSSKQKLATAIHEGNHFLTAKRFGLNPK
jgi:hypothetical protein